VRSFVTVNMTSRPKCKPNENDTLISHHAYLFYRRIRCIHHRLFNGAVSTTSIIWLEIVTTVEKVVVVDC